MYQEHVDRSLKLCRREPFREHHERNQEGGVDFPVDQMKCDLIRYERVEFVRKRDTKSVVGRAGRNSALEQPRAFPKGLYEYLRHLCAN